MQLTPGLPGCPLSEAVAASGVHWVSPVSTGMRETLAQWCRGTGALILEQPSAPYTATDSLLVVSWNVNAGGGDLMRFLRDELQLPCDSVGGPSAPMVVLLQEPYRSGEIPPRASDARAQRAAPEGKRPGARVDLPTVARACRLGLVYVPAVRNGKKDGPSGAEDRGNAILSSVPMSGFAVIDLPPEAPRRVVLSATITFGGASLRIASAHLSTMPLPYRMLTSGNGSRLFQAMAVVEGLALLPAVDATLLAGDFNTWSSNESAMRILFEHFPDSPKPLGQSTRGHFQTDYVLFRRDAPAAKIALVPGSYRRLDDRFYSDHYPLVVRLGLIP